MRRIAFAAIAVFGSAFAASADETAPAYRLGTMSVITNNRGCAGGDGDRPVAVATSEVALNDAGGLSITLPQLVFYRDDSTVFAGGLADIVPNTANSHLGKLKFLQRSTRFSAADGYVFDDPLKLKVTGIEVETGTDTLHVKFEASLQASAHRLCKISFDGKYR